MLDAALPSDGAFRLVADAVRRVVSNVGQHEITARESLAQAASNECTGDVPVTATTQSVAMQGHDSALRQRLVLLQSGDEQAWALVFRELWPVVLKAARHPAAGLTAGEAEEVASEALAQLVSRVGQVSNLGELTALAATIAHRRAISSARAKSAAKRGPTPLSLSDQGADGISIQEIVAPGGGLRELELAEMAMLLREVLASVDSTTRGLLQDKIVAGLSYQELAAKHGMPVGTACAKIARALQRIRKRLEESPALMKELRAFLR